jgi:hypothetical protein
VKAWLEDRKERRLTTGYGAREKNLGKRKAALPVIVAERGLDALSISAANDFAGTPARVSGYLAPGCFVPIS